MFLLLVACLFPLNERITEITLELSDAHPELHLLKSLLVLEDILDSGPDDRLLVVADHLFDEGIQVPHLEIAYVETTYVVGVVTVYQVQ